MPPPAVGGAPSPKRNMATAPYSAVHAKGFEVKSRRTAIQEAPVAKEQAPAASETYVGEIGKRIGEPSRFRTPHVPAHIRPLVRGQWNRQREGAIAKDDVLRVAPIAVGVVLKQQPLVTCPLKQ